MGRRLDVETLGERHILRGGGFTAANDHSPFEMSTAFALSPFLGAFIPPSGLVVTLVILLVVLLVGRVLLGIAWRLVLVALGVVVILWLVGAIASLLTAIG